MKLFVKYHVLPLLCGLVLAFFTVLVLVKTGTLKSSAPPKKVLSAPRPSDSHIHSSLASDEKTELNLYASLREKKGITLFGSSELGVTSDYLSYNFLSDSLGIRVDAFGHAFQQNFAVFCQLLAFKKELKDAKICFILSPGWFEQEGTNIEAFLEFVRPNFLKRIAADQSIPLETKLEIGRYLHENYGAIENPGSTINYFVNLYRYKKMYGLNDFFRDRYKEIQPVEYVLEANKKTERKNITIDWEKRVAEAESLFVASVHNSIFVNDSYFKEYVQKEDGSLHTGTFSELDIKHNRELDDFMLLIDLVVASGCKPTFVIQGMNPYHYEHLDRFNPVLLEITQTLDRYKIPYLNLFTGKKADYQPGTLTDIMHMGDVSWLKVNEFLVKHYDEK